MSNLQLIFLIANIYFASAHVIKGNYSTAGGIGMMYLGICVCILAYELYKALKDK